MGSSTKSKHVSNYTHDFHTTLVAMHYLIKALAFGKLNNENLFLFSFFFKKGLE